MAVYRRRPPGAASGAATLYARIAPDAAALIDETARRCGVSKAEFVEQLAQHLAEDLDNDGVPTWWTQALPHDQELHLDAS